MRCPSCGTENVPDSRFCGICGAKLTPTAEPRVAPTAKIPDDAAFAPGHFASPHPSAAASPAPPSIPPNSGYSPQPASIPPNTYIAPAYATGPATLPPRSATPAPSPVAVAPDPYQAPTYPREPSMSMPAVASPRWGLIILLLVLDLGLAGTGAYLLQKGLAKPDAPVEQPERHPAATAAATVPAALPATAAPQPGLAASVTAIAQTAPGEPAPPSASAASSKTVAVARAKAPAPKGAYDAVAALPGEIELAAARVKGDFASCQAQESGEVHGRIDISFTIERDGGVTRVTSISDTTGSRTLAPCLISVIGRWAFASHPASPTNFVRPFIYN
jgi:hypothetical protein